MNRIGAFVGEQTRTSRCDEHGEFESRCYGIGEAVIWTKCPACTEAREAAQRAIDDAKAADDRSEKWRRQLGQAEIPERFQDRTIDGFVAESGPQRRAKAFAQEYAEGFDGVLKTGRCALFLGRPGTGKTHLAVGICRRAMEQHRTALFSTVMRAIRRIKSSWHRSADETEDAAIKVFVEPDLLVLDEVGVQFGSETEQMYLFDILNERYERRRPTILLSNLAVHDVQRYLGERVFDRLREDGGAVIPFDWESHRGRGAR